MSKKNIIILISVFAVVGVAGYILMKKEVSESEVKPSENKLPKSYGAKRSENLGEEMPNYLKQPIDDTVITPFKNTQY
jgi:hypothetical protein